MGSRHRSVILIAAAALTAALAPAVVAQTADCRGLADPTASPVLDCDAGFEYPPLADASPIDATSVASWQVSASHGNPLFFLRSDGEAAQGARYVEIRTDGNEPKTQAISQTLTRTFQAQDRLMADAWVRAATTAPTGIDVRLRVLTAAGEVVGELPIGSSDLATSWKRYSLWPVVPGPGHLGQPVKLELSVGGMGTDPGFSVFLDRLVLETFQPAPGATVPNGSFELPDLVAAGQTSAHALDHLSDENWNLFSAVSSLLTLETDGGSDGPQYVRASAQTGSTSTWNVLRVTGDFGGGLDGSTLNGESRYQVSGDARYRGLPPAGQGQVWMKISPTPPHHNLDIVSRRKVSFWELGPEYRTFLIRSQKLPATISSGGPVVWTRGQDPFTLRFDPSNPTNAGSAVEIDNLRFDEITPFEAYGQHGYIIVGSNRAVPNWLVTEERGWYRSNGDSSYHLYLPVGVDLAAAGRIVESDSEPSPIGQFFDQYQVAAPGGPADEVSIRGERYNRWELDQTYGHASSSARYAGPIYLTTTLPPGTDTRLYYQTTWVDGTTPMASPIRKLDVRIRDFPRLRKPQHLLSTLGWMSVMGQRSWPAHEGEDFLRQYEQFGFNAVGGHRIYDGYVTSGVPGADDEFVAQTVQDHYADAGAAGYLVFANDSPFFWRGAADEETFSIDATTLLPVADEPCPSYGLVEPDPAIYRQDIAQTAGYAAAILPEYLHLDIEQFTAGSTRALAGQCVRCNAYLAARPELPDMTAALKQMGVDMAQDFQEAFAAAGATPAPQLAFYHTKPGQPYQGGLFALEDLVDSGFVDFGLSPSYTSLAYLVGQTFRSIQADTLAAVPPIPYVHIMHTGTVGEYHPAWVYDHVTELFGSGARGVYWFAFFPSEAADFYYYAQAMQSVLPVEQVIATSQPVGLVDVTIADPGMTQEEIDQAMTDTALQGFAVRSGNDHVFLVSSYGRTVTGPTPNYQHLEIETYTGPVAVTLPEAVTGTPLRLADCSAGTPVIDANQVVLDFEPGVEGARTALFYLGDSIDPAVCADADLDGVGNALDSCPYLANPAQRDVDGDGQGDLCDADDGRVTLYFPDVDRLGWDRELAPDAWNVYRGNLDVLRAGGAYSQAPGSNAEALRDCGQAAPDWQDTHVASPGQAAFYLVAPVIAGIESGLGQDSEGTERPHDAPCP